MKLRSRRSFLALGTGAIVIGVGAFTVTRPALRAQTAMTLTPPEALVAARSGEILLVDIRRPDEWRLNGVAEPAITIDMRAPDFTAQLQQLRQSRSQPVAVICARGVRSARLSRRLEEAQLGPILDVPEGMLGSFAGPGWLKRDLPVREYTEA